MKTTLEFATDIVKQSIQSGASAAEVIIREGIAFSGSVRLGQVETLKESDSKGLGLLVLCNGKQATVSSSDFSKNSIDKLISTAISLAQATSVDSTAGLPDSKDLAKDWPDLNLYDEAIANLSAKEKIEMAIQSEAAARDFDSRIENFEGGGIDSFVGHKILANSSGFAGEYSSTSISLATVPIAQENGKLQRDYWYDSRCILSQMESPSSIGRKAAERTIRKLGAKKIKTQLCPIVFDPLVSSSLLGDIFDVVSGDSVFRKASFLIGKIGETIAVSDLTIVDDGRIPSVIGARPFDDEGIPTQRTIVVQNGVLLTFLNNTYTARKLGMKSTGNAYRGLTGPCSVNSNNFCIQAGKYSAAEIIKSVKNGFYVTELIGSGTNPITGDYSQGAAGIWVENGELTYSVEEVTIAGNLKDMLKDIEMIGDDLDFRNKIVAPTMKFSKMIVSGE